MLNIKKLLRTTIWVWLSFMVFAGCSSQVVEKPYPDPMEILLFRAGRALGEVLDDDSYLIVEMETQDFRAQVIDWYKRQFPADMIDDTPFEATVNDKKYTFQIKSLVQGSSVECKP